jgi:hypothetical protein
MIVILLTTNVLFWKNDPEKRARVCTHPDHAKNWRSCAFAFVDNPEVLLENCPGGIKKFIEALPTAQQKCFRKFLEKHVDLWSCAEYKAAFGGPKKKGELGSEDEDFV